MKVIKVRENHINRKVWEHGFSNTTITLLGATHYGIAGSIDQEGHKICGGEQNVKLMTKQKVLKEMLEASETVRMRILEGSIYTQL